LQSEVQRLQQELQEREQALESFKRRNMGRLPSQLQTNLNILSQLKEELSKTEDRQEQVRQQMRLITQQAHMQAQDVFADFSAWDSDTDMGNSELATLQERLKEMRSKYKEQHPDVQALLRRISQLEQEQELEVAMEPEPEPEPDLGLSGQDMLQVQQEQMQMRLADYKAKIQELKSQIQLYEQRVEETSEVELQLKNLERDYAAVNDRFQNVLRRKLDAEMAEQMERRQQGEQFRVVDPAITPDKPFKPDRNKIMAMALVMGLGLGGGLGYLRESLDPTFYTPQELEQQLHTKVVVSLPMVHEEKKGKR
jgi:uncharacterized protein involved in exopolysaccharide biosynthesis